MFLFGLGKLLYVIILIINAIAILSEDRFLARIGWGRTQYDPGFGAASDNTSIKAKSVNLIASVRTVMRTRMEEPFADAWAAVLPTNQ
ncbi:hypothetical protein AJ78_00368 [Emergomyces pasteurianus Ep9510]|uniref:Uncharacterized protein n=1 Tax=Emergomyces pasteurianus Ep9510 TaxID=1447872 RepID=A0A1J9QWF9_9EURO|nr:hypothetical protein AJ78_00368 [Emergomyces pasteurianus Ep9510]